MPSRVNWPVMGGPTTHPTGVTLALGDPLSSLNAPGGSLGYFREQGARGPAPLVALERFLGLAVAASVVAVSERDSDKRSGPPRRRGSIAGASCLAVCVEVENMGPLPRNWGMTGGQEGTEVIVPWLEVVAAWLAEQEQVNWLEAKRLMVAGQQPPSWLVGRRALR